MNVLQPTDRPSDPLAALIADYRTQLAIYNASGDLSTEDDLALGARTIDPPWFRLRDDCPMPTSMEGVIEAIRLLNDELNRGGTGGFELSVLAALNAYLDGRAAA